MPPEISELRQVFSYDPETGAMHRASKDGGPAKRAECAGNPDGRPRVTHKGQKMFAYRVAWALHFGRWPKGEIDHINGVVSDSRIANLRDVSRRVNQENVRRPRGDNSSGALGVSRNRGKYFAQIKVNGKTIALGRFDAPEDAHSAYVRAKRKLHEGCTI